MSIDALYQRLAQIVLEIERLDTSRWQLERERDQLRAELRRLNANPPRVVPA